MCSNRIIPISYFYKFMVEFFYFFSSLILILALLAINTKNTVYSVLFLILIFCNSTGLLLTFNIEFVSIMLIIIYVGAIAVLFLFIIMMLDIKKNIYEKFSYFLICLLIGLIFLYETFISINIKNIASFQNYNEWYLYVDSITNIETVGQILYTYYSIFFLLSGIILLIALIGATILTLKKNIKQDSFKQLSRNNNFSIYKIN